MPYAIWQVHLNSGTANHVGKVAYIRRRSGGAAFVGNPDVVGSEEDMSIQVDRSSSLVDEINEEFIKLLKDSGDLEDGFIEILVPFVKKGDLKKYQLVNKLLRESDGEEK